MCPKPRLSLSSMSRAVVNPTRRAAGSDVYRLLWSAARSLEDSNRKTNQDDYANNIGSFHTFPTFESQHILPFLIP